MDKHLLIVDDEPAIVAALKRLLRKCGYSIRTANSAEQALQMMHELPAKVVLSDYQMPQVNGLQLLEKIALQWPDTTRLILTGSNDCEESLTGNVVHKVLEKPWSSDLLIDILEQAFLLDKADLSTNETHNAGSLINIDQISEGMSVEPIEEQESELPSFSAISAVALIDIDAIEQLISDVSEEGFPELAELFIQSIEPRLDELAQVSQQKSVQSNIEIVRRQLHTVASSMALYGLARCGQYARYYERAPVSEIEQHLARFVKQSRESITAFNEHMSTRN
jgi:response regulator RpfG family c-di-GMP phosphodiesterase